jgi:tetratricopeptide (TPR) repeat protein
MKNMPLILLSLVLVACGPAQVVQQSHLDTASNHYQRGLLNFDRGDIMSAQREFERTRLLEGDFPGSYVGFALVAMQRGDFFRARKEIEMALHKENEFVDAHIAKGRIATAEGIARGEATNKWLPEALRAYRKAQDVNPEYPPSYFFAGQSYLQAQNLPLARASYTRLIELNHGPFVARAMHKVEQIQMVERAAPGTVVGIKIALEEEISRGELAVLLLEELKLAELVLKRRPINDGANFQTPGDQANLSNPSEAVDIGHYWAKPWIEEILALGVPGLELFPDHSFQPEQAVTRANYALVNQGILVLLSGDRSLSIRYVGESSRFSDVRSDFYAYNAIALSTERGLMAADKRTGHFYPERTVSGAEALLMVRELQNSFRMEY